MGSRASNSALLPTESPMDCIVCYCACSEDEPLSCWNSSLESIVSVWTHRHQIPHTPAFSAAEQRPPWASDLRDWLAEVAHLPRTLWDLTNTWAFVIRRRTWSRPKEGLEGVVETNLIKGLTSDQVRAFHFSNVRVDPASGVGEVDTNMNMHAYGNFNVRSVGRNGA